MSQYGAPQNASGYEDQQQQQPQDADPSYGAQGGQEGQEQYGSQEPANEAGQQGYGDEQGYGENHEQQGYGEEGQGFEGQQNGYGQENQQYGGAQKQGEQGMNGQHQHPQHQQQQQQQNGHPLTHAPTHQNGFPPNNQAGSYQPNGAIHPSAQPQNQMQAQNGPPSQAHSGWGTGRNYDKTHHNAVYHMSKTASNGFTKDHMDSFLHLGTYALGALANQHSLAPEKPHHHGQEY